MAKSFNNPFRTAPGSSPPFLVGRDAELSTVDYAIRGTASGAAPSPVIFTGLRGMGKTALLRRAAAEAREQKGIVIYAEATDTEQLGSIFREGLEDARNRFDSFRGRLKQTVDTVLRYLPKAEFELPGDAGSIALSGSGTTGEQQTFVALLRELNAEAWKHARFLVLIVDELQSSSLADLNRLVRFVHETAGTDQPALLLGAGLPNVRGHLEKAKTYTERWTQVEITFLTAEQSAQAIRKPIIDAGHQITDRAIDTLVNEAAGYPFFLQAYSSAVWQHHVGKRIDEKDVSAIVPGVRLQLENSFYGNRFRTLSPRECSYVIALAQLGAGAHTVAEIAHRLGATSEQVSSIRNQLVRKDVVFSPAGGLIEFRMPLSERYVADHLDELERRSQAKNSTSIQRLAQQVPREPKRER